MSVCAGGRIWQRWFHRHRDRCRQAQWDAINRGESLFKDVATPVVAALVESGKLRAVPDMEAAGRLDTINICVPTPLRKTKDPDLSHVISAARAVTEHLHAGMLVILESMTYPGTTEEVVQSILEETGLKAGIDFFLAFSPERVDPGNEKWHTRNVPKVVGRPHARLLDAGCCPLRGVHRKRCASSDRHQPQ
jgi:UDP-N-acetyl-D-glucosamine dehydrogenase